VIGTRRVAYSEEYCFGSEGGRAAGTDWLTAGGEAICVKSSRFGTDDEGTGAGEGEGERTEANAS
jgi:hypothetical protein